LPFGRFFLILAISVLTGVVFEAPPQLTKKQVLRAIHANATSRPLTSHLSVAVGTNVCVDLIVDAEAFFSAAGASLPKHTAAALADAPASSSVSSEQDLVNVFSHFFNRGAAAERFVDPALFEKLVATAEGLSSTEPRLGGNAALIGNVLARQGHSVAMVAPDGPTLRALVHDRVRLVGATAAAVEKHIILEYGVGATFQGLNSDRANRVILTPAGAPSVHALDDFAGLLSETAADKAVDAVVVSGLHLLEPTSREEWGPYLEKAHTALASGVASRPQHLELASLSNQQLTQVRMRAVRCVCARACITYAFGEVPWVDANDVLVLTRAHLRTHLRTHTVAVCPLRCF
jgi:ADP-dependent phosphofructokinase/glucokinase